MKRIRDILSLMLLSIVMLMNPFNTTAQKADSLKTALVLVDIQYFYFPGSKGALVNPEIASANAALILKKFRENGQMVVHVRHNAKSAAEIYPDVSPLNHEKVISKNYVNSFRDTDLLEYLQNNGIKQLIICGMMTHMCVEATTRAAADYGFKCVVIADACATRDLKYEDKVIPAEQVHYSTLSTIASAYGKVMDTKQFLEVFRF
jgi:nicotinamidase-related amidase